MVTSSVKIDTGQSSAKAAAIRSKRRVAAVVREVEVESVYAGRNYKTRRTRWTSIVKQ